ncbi:hypothetical protein CAUPRSCDRAFT_10978, partial [Caulochytrium protostelioides]
MARGRGTVARRVKGHEPAPVEFFGCRLSPWHPASAIRYGPGDRALSWALYHRLAPDNDGGPPPMDNAPWIMNDADAATAATPAHRAKALTASAVSARSWNLEHNGITGVFGNSLHEARIRHIAGGVEVAPGETQTEFAGPCIEYADACRAAFATVGPNGGPATPSGRSRTYSSLPEAFAYPLVGLCRPRHARRDVFLVLQTERRLAPKRSTRWLH